MRYGKVINEGKTKVVNAIHGDDTLAVLSAKDDITAGDGVKHDVMRDKAEIATATTCNVFRLLQKCGVDVAFKKQLGPSMFLASKCSMLPFEVVVRREAHGSYLKRNKHIKRGHVFPQLIVEFYLKTSGRMWDGKPIPKDDPFMQIEGEKIRLFRADLPLHEQEPFMELDTSEVLVHPRTFGFMADVAIRTFLVLEKAWQLQGCRLCDFKIEFGLDHNDQLLVADVIDNDSWRVLQDGAYIDKQSYRNDEELDVVREKYKLVRDLTSRFSLPKQRVIVWRGSSSDQIEVLRMAAMAAMSEPGEDLTLETVTCSMHKEPVRGCRKITELVQEIPDSVVIACIGMSNGAGPMLAAQVTVPVISMPITVEYFPNDVWSSLRLPSKVPALTILNPRNAMLAALQILAMRNPRIYADLRMDQETRLVNF